MNILSIGNSFSQDAQRYLHSIAACDNIDLFCTNLYIGGCSLEKHCENIDNDVAAYDCEINGGCPTEKISIKSALKRENWDIITVQQVSGQSGIIDSYYPFLPKLISYIKTYCPSAEIVLHQTWSYETGSTHGSFPDYDCDRNKMAEKIISTCETVAKNEKINCILKCGEVIASLRKTKYFNYETSGISLCRDGFHLSLDYGRYAAALCWYRTLCKADITKNEFIPGDGSQQIEPEMLEIIKKTVSNIVDAPQ